MQGDEKPCLSPGRETVRKEKSDNNNSSTKKGVAKKRVGPITPSVRNARKSSKKIEA